MTTRKQDAELKQLSGQFRRFRQQTSGLRPKIPQQLRLKALALRRQGLSSLKIANACGFSSGLLSLWGNRDLNTDQNYSKELQYKIVASPSVAAPRVLDVIEKNTCFSGMEISVNQDGIFFRFPRS